MQVFALPVGLMAWTMGWYESGTAQVAVVNVPEVSDKYQRTADLEAQFDAIRVKFNQDRDAMKDRLDRTAKSLREELKPGTDEFRERAKQASLLEAELKWFVEAEGQKIEEGLKNSLRSIFDDVQAAVREVAEEKGIDIVVACDRIPDQVPESPTQLRQQIVLQKVLYWNPRTDITADVVNRLNARYQARPAQPNAAAIPPADAGKAKPKPSEAKRPG